MPKFLDISGIGNSGKSALCDFFREFNNIYVPHFQFEFDLIRTSDGLLDLREAVYENWSPIRSNQAIKRFKKLYMLMGLNPSFLNIWGFYNSSAQRYSNFFGDSYFTLLDDFCNNLVVDKYKGVWPYTELYENNFRRSINRVLTKFKIKKTNFTDISLIDGSKFDEKVFKLMKNLYKPVTKKSDEYIVLNNCVEPFNSKKSLKMLGNAQQIVVIRDPRDIFVSGLVGNEYLKLKNLAGFDNDGKNKSFLSADNINSFCNRLEIFYKNLFLNKNSNKMIIWFEDLVLNKEKTINRILNFINLSKENHTNKGKFFKPKESVKYIGQFKNFYDNNRISIIEKRLGKYLYKNKPLI